MICNNCGKQLEDESVCCSFCGIINYECSIVSEYAVEFTNIYSRKKTLIQVGHKYIYDPPNPKTIIEKNRKGRIVRLEEIYPYCADRVLVKYVDTNRTVMLKNPFFLRSIESNNDESNSVLFKVWIKNITEEEAEIRKKALFYETTLFNDMRLIDYEQELFSKANFSRSLTKEESINFYKSKNRLEFLDSIGVSTENANFDEVDKIQKSISINNWRFEVAESNDNNELGYCDNVAEVIVIKKFSIIDGIADIVLIHEMIHAYEYLLKKTGYDYYVVLQLYKELSLFIKNLDNIINMDNHIIFKEHSILFLLKSLMLDICFGYNFGTFYCYDRNNYFNVFLLNNDLTKLYLNKYKENYNCDYLNVED